MVRGIHYFSAEVNPKLMSSQGAALIIDYYFLFYFLYCTFYAHSTCIVVFVDPRGCIFHLKLQHCFAYFIQNINPWRMVF